MLLQFDLTSVNQGQTVLEGNEARTSLDISN